MRSLDTKLVLAFLLVSLVSIILAGFFIARWVPNEFRAFLVAQDRSGVVEQLVSYYRSRGNWQGIHESLTLIIRPENGGRPQPVALANRAGRVIVPGLGLQMGDRISWWRLAQGIPIWADGERVGTLLVDQRTLEITILGRRFLVAVNRALIRAAVIGMVVAIVLGVVLSRSLTRSLHDLTMATRAMAKGHLEQKVPVRSSDELGELAHSFNQMNAELVRARDLKQQMTADIAHDLRTPLSVILGHAEALAEGVLSPTPERLRLIHNEAKRLSRLVDDLRTLSLAEAGELPLSRRPTLLQVLLERVANAHGPHARQKQIALGVQVDADLPSVQIDPDRIAQVLDNLLDNALRYTPLGGQVVLYAHGHGSHVRLGVQDSGPGLAKEDLERVFERFYRPDKSRWREDGGSGLGLAIARSIVEGHGGRVWAENPAGGGLNVVVQLPVEPPLAAAGGSTSDQGQSPA